MPSVASLLTLSGGPHMRFRFPAPFLAAFVLLALALGRLAPAQATDPRAAPSPAASPGREWQHSALCWLLTTADGAALPASAELLDFPVLLRLARATFAFDEAQPHGEDLRITDGDGAALHYQIEEWDAAAGVASIWVRVPRIVGDARQPMRLHWGNPTANSESDARQVFGEFYAYVSTLHMDATLDDAVGTVQPKDQGTELVRGMIGNARHLNGQSGVFCGDDIEAFPKGAGSSGTEAWFRPELPNTTVLAWGKEQRPGKVMMNLRSPPHIAIQCYFADVEGKRPIAMGEWVHVVHTYQRGDSRVYVDGVLDGAAPPLLDIPDVVRFDIGGWHGHGYVGDVDEVRISNVVRSPEWIRLQYENQKPLQTLVGPLVQGGDAFAASVASLDLREGTSAKVTAQAGGAQKVYWVLEQDGRETVVAVDRFEFTFAAGRVGGDASRRLRFRAVGPETTREIAIPITIREAVPDPDFTLSAPSQWDGRSELVIEPRITNRTAMEQNGANALRYRWSVDGVAVLKHTTPGQLVLERAQGSGAMQVRVSLENGGDPVVRTIAIEVAEPASDPFVPQPVGASELPEDGQFFARDDQGMGSLVCNGALAEAADEVFVRVFADGRLDQEHSAPVAVDLRHALTARLKPGLVHYRAEFGSRRDGRETILHTATDLLCGDVYLVDGQSNAEATDVGKDDPPFHSEWIRTFGSMSGDPNAARIRLWGDAVCRNRDQARLQVGYWALELGRRLVESQQVPICIFNGAVGGTRIDQHQRNMQDPEDVATIYGRLLGRVRQAKLTHGIRAVLWHQGENDQGADGPSGGFGWETYRELFIEMAAGWRRDYPNIRAIYVFQIWPKACAMGVEGSDDMLREVQRTLPRDFSNLSVMSTLGIQPPGGCHYPLAGWAEFARLICPLIERDLYGVVPTASITPPDLSSARYADSARDRILLEFDQPVVWDDALRSEFYLDGVGGQIAAGGVAGKVLTLELASESDATTITYLDSRHWSERNVMRGDNGIAALTFCRVPIGRDPGR